MVRGTRSSRAAARFRVLVFLMALPGAGGTAAQTVGLGEGDPPRAVKSMGQPPLMKPYVAGTVTWSRDGENRTGGVGIAGLYKDLGLPLSGAFGLSVEGYLGGSGGNWDRGARLFATSRLFSLNLGVDWNADRRTARTRSGTG